MRGRGVMSCQRPSGRSNQSRSVSQATRGTGGVICVQDVASQRTSAKAQSSTSGLAVFVSR